MRGDRKSILLCLLIVIKSIGKVTSLDSNDIIAALDSTDKNFQSDPSNVSLQQQRLDEIRALTAMQSKAAAERDARDKVARNFKEAADRQSADAAERQSAASSAKDALDLAEKEVHESTPEEINNAGGELAAAVSNSIEELIVQNLDSVVEVTMKHAERDQDDADESDKDLNLSSTESTNTTPDVMLNSATSAIFDSKTSDINNEDVDDEDVDHEDDVMKEIMEMQHRELREQIEEGESIRNDKAEAEKAEKAAKQAELEAAAEALRKEELAAASKSKKAKADDAWVSRSRPGLEAKPGAKLGQTVSAGSGGEAGTNTDNRGGRSGRERERGPESLRSSSKSGGKGNYFGGQSAADKEAESRRLEAQKRAKETDKMSSGGGDRRREVEAKLSPQMRKKVAAEQQMRAELEQEKASRRARSVISRKFARPVEAVLKVYSSQSTDLYDVLRVTRRASDADLKKAYRALALMVHPDKNFHPDSKVAFEAIQEAFETLSSPVKRDAYDSEQRKRTGRPSLKRTISRMKGEYSNLKSRLMLFWVRVFVRGEGSVEFKELVGDRMTAMNIAVSRTLEHFALQPSAIDRLRLVTEMTYDFRRNVFSSALLAALLVG